MSSPFSVVNLEVKFLISIFASSRGIEMLHALVTFTAVVGVLGAADAIRTTDRSLGTLVGCPSADSGCLWAGENGDVVDSHMMRELFIQLNNLGTSNEETYRRNLQTHMTYIEAVNKYAKTLGHEFSYHMGVNERQLAAPLNQNFRPEEFVDQEVSSARSRRLETQATNSSSSGSSTYWNWCDAENSLGHSACSSVKSQKSCGSCWSFAAADAIETAVVIAENASAAVALSPQQFLTCSTLEMTKTFDYCWASDNGVDGATWMQSEIKWESQNSGCNGGMTHAAFQDAAQNGWGLVTELTMPYDDDSSSGSSSASNTSSVCSSNSNNSAASISGWEQIVGADCSTSSNCTTLLRSAVEKQPIAVAITSNGGFSSYAGGFYSCPNNGVLSSKNDLNHAILLVGYGTDSSVGDYWILKNSYGRSWGDSGFMKLIADSKVNCGLNVFPVIPTGAKAGAQAATSIDSGGDKIFVGLSPTAWIVVAAAATVFTIATTALGVFVSHRKLKKLRKNNLASFVLTPR